MKYGRVKREHSRVKNLDDLLDRVVKQCPLVDRIIPGRISRRKGNSGPTQLRCQYATGSGLKCLFCTGGSVQEVFLVSSDPAGVTAWLQAEGIVGKEPETAAP